MPLSEHEQRLLDQLERQLNADDPHFVSSMMGTRQPEKTSLLGLRSLFLGAFFLLVGVALVILGVSVKLLLVSVLGFVVAVAGVHWAISRPVDTRDQSYSVGLTEPSGSSFATINQPSAAKKSKFMAELEEKWDQRRYGV